MIRISARRTATMESGDGDPARPDWRPRLPLDAPTRILERHGASQGEGVHAQGVSPRFHGGPVGAHVSSGHGRVSREPESSRHAAERAGPSKIRFAITEHLTAVIEINPLLKLV